MSDTPDTQPSVSPPGATRAMPVFVVKDVSASIRFYTEKLGFKLGGVWGEPASFAIVFDGDVRLALDRSESGEPIKTSIGQPTSTLTTSMPATPACASVASTLRTPLVMHPMAVGTSMSAIPTDTSLRSVANWTE